MAGLSITLTLNMKNSGWVTSSLQQNMAVKMMAQGIIQQILTLSLKKPTRMVRLLIFQQAFTELVALYSSQLVLEYKVQVGHKYRVLDSISMTFTTHVWLYRLVRKVMWVIWR
ncbi:hypothetical protein I7I50_06092 [Histoplasma capsulatum G186AR]|uniref:Uncharacterized protein n=1 Tax=Ajellomyces capsulatus TaxID=5037 RepID=A0A8H7YVQ1_AJECA|nr:hypothetical protein I7I52_08830 [Histoplasma capsulatum]QSS67105.1 hypothetical protein I7I50_06092 [Histoplasma capsulatum G186AR]